MLSRYFLMESSQTNDISVISLQNNETVQQVLLA